MHSKFGNIWPCPYPTPITTDTSLSLSPSLSLNIYIYIYNFWSEWDTKKSWLDWFVCLWYFTMLLLMGGVLFKSAPTYYRVYLFAEVFLVVNFLLHASWWRIYFQHFIHLYSFFLYFSNFWFHIGTFLNSFYDWEFCISVEVVSIYAEVWIY